MEYIGITGKCFLVIKFLRLIHPEIILKDLNLTTCEENEKQYLKQGKTKARHTSEDRQNQGTILMPTLAPRPLTSSCTIPVELPPNYMVGQQ